MFNDCSELNKVLYLLKRAAGPFGNGFHIRKQLTKNMQIGENFKEVYLEFYGGKRYVLKVMDGYVCAIDGEYTICRVPFVPWDGVDMEWELILSMDEDPVTKELIVPEIPEELITRLISRFDNEVWNLWS